MKPTVTCGKCSSPLQWGDRFCGSCGTAIEWPDAQEGHAKPGDPQDSQHCPECGATVRAGTTSCASCGADLREPARARSADRKRNARRKSGRAKSGGVSLSPRGKMIAGVVVVVIGGALIWELSSGDRMRPTMPQGQGAVQQGAAGQSQASGANMQALPQIEEMEDELARNPNNHQLMLALANTLQDNGFLDKAITYYKQYVDHHPDDADALVDLGICYNDINQFDEAKRWMKKALESTPKHVLAHFNLGVVSLRAGEIDEANEWFRKTVSLDPNSTIAQRAQQLLTPHTNLQNAQ